LWLFYACSAELREETVLFTALRRYAEARDWDIANQIIDRHPPSVPFHKRVLWPRVADAVSTRRAEGALTLDGYLPDDDVAELADWASTHGAFIVRLDGRNIPEPARSGLAPGPLTPPQAPPGQRREQMPTL
jgi:hypothetical protein